MKQTDLIGGKKKEKSWKLQREAIRSKFYCTIPLNSSLIDIPTTNVSFSDYLPWLSHKIPEWREHLWASRNEGEKTAAGRKTVRQMSENIKKETNYTVNESIKLCFHFGSLLFKDEKSADNKAVTFYFEG